MITLDTIGLLRALVAVTAPVAPVVTGVCTCCDEEWALRSLAPVDTDYTYLKAVTHECSFERDALVCEDCRADFEHTYGRDDDDCYDLYCRGCDRND